MVLNCLDEELGALAARCVFLLLFFSKPETLGLTSTDLIHRSLAKINTVGLPYIFINTVI